MCHLPSRPHQMWNTSELKWQFLGLHSQLFWSTDWTYTTCFFSLLDFLKDRVFLFFYYQVTDFDSSTYFLNSTIFLHHHIYISLFWNPVLTIRTLLVSPNDLLNFHPKRKIIDWEWIFMRKNVKMTSETMNPRDPKGRN